MWNVKTTSSSHTIQQQSVLIETLWNVKDGTSDRWEVSVRCINRNIVECKVTFHLVKFVGKCRVLIETLWNVKQFLSIRHICTSACINRNIVECKALMYGDMTWMKRVLIETLWNVKLDLADQQILQRSVLIETLWNVKVGYLWWTVISDRLY